MQGDRERELNLDASMFMDRASTNLAKSQIGFISFLVQVGVLCVHICVEFQITQTVIFVSQRTDFECLCSSEHRTSQPMFEALAKRQKLTFWIDRVKLNLAMWTARAKKQAETNAPVNVVVTVCVLQASQ